MENDILKGIRDILKYELEPIKKQLQKNTIILEELKSKIDIVVEVQGSHIGQNEKEHIQIMKSLSEKVEVIELAVKDTSKDVKELKQKFEKVERVTIQNTYDVAYLKSVK
ncbi:hypothetical protein CLTEP_08560 [Clostridium tepidiprofundi DSM 19306]|uniref:Uncharacterized protein n=1 Tax=Clostridium tepidiprofundi DSM 19306 TaxID=1121338 RepID=A0A151B5N1_9CLOT|nr:hypothetical protein [Clostridium tepidiprofundi]KYH35231.1 hypothetical protein CLTEP_08560 [Clostridium tepidiprofundi DSM 19306]